MLDPKAHYFPTPDTPGFAPFAMAFVHLMFAHAEFERRFRDLQSAVAYDPRSSDPPFGEQPSNQWKTRHRSKLMEALIRQHFGDDAPEIPKITEVLKRVIPLCDDRNLLAHGTWWEFNPGTGTITVARGTTRPGERANVSFTVHQIEAIASRIQDAEAELWHLKRAIENRHPRGYV